MPRIGNADGDTGRIVGTALAGGGVRLESTENADAWIEADYKEGWVGRKLLTTDDDDAYADMTHPYYYRCRCCRQYRAVERWGKGSQFCPRCEQKWKFGISLWFDVTEDGELPTPTHSCPECGSDELEIGVVADYDACCETCGNGFSVKEEPA